MCGVVLCSMNVSLVLLCMTPITGAQGCSKIDRIDMISLRGRKNEKDEGRRFDLMSSTSVATALASIVLPVPAIQ